MADRKLFIQELSQILPLDEESLAQMVDYALKLPTHSAITEYWLGLLGESPAALDFITNFTAGSVSSSSSSRVPSRSVTPKPAPWPQQPQQPQSQQPRTQSNAWNQPPVQKTSLNTLNNPRLSKSTGATTTSQLLDKPKEKLSKQSTKRHKQRKVDSLEDLEAILRQLEVKNTDEARVCNCMATRHPLFEVAPNCTNCGKIICAVEGLRPCSFCGHDLISKQEREQIVKYLEAEREELGEKPKEVVSEQRQKKKKITIASGTGVNLWEEQEKIFKSLENDMEKKAKLEKKKQEEKKEVAQQDKELQYYSNQKGQDEDLRKAKANLENLLNFQANSAERTRIIDQASDYDLPTGSNLNMWSSGVEKALQLKKQQKMLRKQEKKEKELTGRGKRVLDITIGKDGKAVMREMKSSAATAASIDLSDSDEDEEDNDEIARLEGALKSQKEAKTKEDYASVWDPEKDANKWEKPVYVGKEGDSGSTEDSADFPEFKWDRVQQLQSSDRDLEDLVAVL